MGEAKRHAQWLKEHGMSVAQNTQQTIQERVSDITNLPPTHSGKPCEYVEWYTGHDGNGIKCCTNKQHMLSWGLSDEDVCHHQMCVREHGIPCRGFLKGKDGKPIRNA